MPVCRDCLSRPEPFEAEYFCAACKTPFLNPFPLAAEGICALCRSGLRGFDAAFTFGFYEGRLRELIHLYKYRRMKPLWKPLSGFLADALPRDRSFDAVVPVPLHWRKQWQRGFNQAELLAQAMAKRCGVKCVNAMRRRRFTPPQASLSPAGRRQNVAAAFRVKKTDLVRGRNILLIDDVLTTGATASACGHALKRAGAKSVTLLTLARADRRLGNPVSYKNREGTAAW